MSIELTLNPEKLEVIREMDPRVQSYNIEMTELTGGTFWVPYTPEQISGEEAFPTCDKMEDMMKMLAGMQRVFIVTDRFMHESGAVSYLAGQMGDMPAGPEACRQPDGSWLMPGRLTVDAVTSWLGIHLPPRSSSATLAGLLLEALGHIPHEGERVRIQGWRMKIVKMDGNRIDEVLVRRLEH